MKPVIKRAATAFCVIFTITMGLWSLAGLAFAGPERGIVLTLTILLACAALVALQVLWFAEAPLRRVAYPLRVLGFGLTALPALALCARLGTWFPLNETGAWASFCVIYLAVLAVTTVGYTLYYRRAAGSYDAALARYREDRAE